MDHRRVFCSWYHLGGKKYFARLRLHYRTEGINWNVRVIISKYSFETSFFTSGVLLGHLSYKVKLRYPAAFGLWDLAQGHCCLTRWQVMQFPSRVSKLSNGNECSRHFINWFHALVLGSGKIPHQQMKQHINRLQAWCPKQKPFCFTLMYGSLSQWLPSGLCSFPGSTCISRSVSYLRKARDC